MLIVLGPMKFGSTFTMEPVETSKVEFIRTNMLVSKSTMFDFQMKDPDATKMSYSIEDILNLAKK